MMDNNKGRFHIVFPASRARVVLFVALTVVGAVALSLGGWSLNVEREVLQASASSDVSVWWPASGVTLTGAQPFKAMLAGGSLDQYYMFWQVDGGGWNWMGDNYTDYPHKEVSVDVSGWSWRGAGPYTLNFIAQDRASGSIIAQQPVSIFVGTGAVLPTATPSPSPTPVPSPVSSGNPFQNAKLYADPYSYAKKQANDWRGSRPQDAAIMDRIANEATPLWFGNWNWDVRGDADRLTSTVTSQGALPLYIVYNIPQRDCGGYSGGGAESPDAYKSWIRSLAEGLNKRKSVVILEPDALAGMDCLNAGDRAVRAGLISDAVDVLKSAGAAVYIDAGNSYWVASDVIAERLKSAGIAKADGFTLNISNFISDAENSSYGKSISAKVGNKHFIFDTSRNGAGSATDREWCNPSGRALGRTFTTNTNEPLVDAYIWMKIPGASDGNCNGGPNAGQWMPEYALDLARRAGW